MKITIFDRAIITAIPYFGQTSPQSRLVNFHDTRRLDHRRFFLPLRKLLGALAVYIYAREFFAVRVVNGNLPMVVFAPFIVAHSAGFLRLGFFHVVPSRIRDYGKFAAGAQVTS
jgi:hypothetical protein